MATLKGITEDPRFRIGVLAGTLVLLLAVALPLVITWEPTEEDVVASRMDQIILAIEQENIEWLSQMIVVPFDYSRGQEMTTLDDRMMNRFLLRTFGRFTGFDVDIVDSHVSIMDDQQTAVADTVFHWSLVSRYYPGTRTRSRDMTKDGRPWAATVIFNKIDAEWYMQSVAFHGPDIL